MNYAALFSGRVRIGRTSLLWFRCQHRSYARLRSLLPIRSNKAMTRNLSKLIVNAYLLSIITCATPVWEYLAVLHKKKRHTAFSTGGLRLTAKGILRFPSHLLRSGLGVCSLDDTVRRFADHSRLWQVAYTSRQILY